MRKEYGPAIVDPTVETDAALGRLRLEVWSRISKS
jgi:hypothetical protein